MDSIWRYAPQIRPLPTRCDEEPIKYGFHGGRLGLGPAIEYKLSNNITINGLYETISLNSGSVNGSSTGYGLGVRLYLNEALTEDTYVNFAVITGNAKGSDNIDSIEVSADSIILTYGKTWMWDNFNLDGSIGISSISIGTINKTSNIDTSAIENLDGPGVSISFGIGYAF